MNRQWSDTSIVMRWSASVRGSHADVGSRHALWIVALVAFYSKIWHKTQSADYAN